MWWLQVRASGLKLGPSLHCSHTLKAQAGSTGSGYYGPSRLREKGRVESQANMNKRKNNLCYLSRRE